MEVLGLQVLDGSLLGGKGQEVMSTLMGVTVEVDVTTDQGHLPWTGQTLVVPTGEERLRVRTRGMPMKTTRTPGLKNPGSLARSQGEAS